MTNAATATDRIHLELIWADWTGKRKSTADPEILAPILEAELQAHIASGDYPADSRFEGLLEPGVLGTFQHPVIEVSLPDMETVFDFYTAYCGGDSMQAEDELEMGYGFTAPEGWTPKG